jgi:hypothetical protein
MSCGYSKSRRTSHLLLIKHSDSGIAWYIGWAGKFTFPLPFSIQRLAQRTPTSSGPIYIARRHLDRIYLKVIGLCIIYTTCSLQLRGHHQYAPGGVVYAKSRKF